MLAPSCLRSPHQWEQSQLWRCLAPVQTCVATFCGHSRRERLPWPTLSSCLPEILVWKTSSHAIETDFTLLYWMIDFNIFQLSASGWTFKYPGILFDTWNCWCCSRLFLSFPTGRDSRVYEFVQDFPMSGPPCGEPSPLSLCRGWSTLLKPRQDDNCRTHSIATCPPHSRS